MHQEVRGSSDCARRDRESRSPGRSGGHPQRLPWRRAAELFRVL